MSLLSLVQLPLQCFLNCAKHCPEKVHAIDKAHRDKVRDNCGFILLEQLKSSNFVQVVDVLNKSISPRLRLGGIPGDDAQSKALRLVQAGMTRMTSAFVQAVSRETLLKLEETREYQGTCFYHLISCAQLAMNNKLVEIVTAVFEKYWSDESVMRAGMKLCYYMSDAQSVKASFSYAMLHHIEHSMIVFKESELMVLLAMDTASSALCGGDHLDKISFVHPLMKIVQDCMRMYAKSVDVQTSACRLLMYLVKSYDGRRAAYYLRIVQEVTQALEAFPKDGALHYFAFWFLNAMVESDEDMKCHIREQPGLKLCIRKAKTQFWFVMYCNVSPWYFEAEERKYEPTWLSKEKRLWNDIDTRSQFGVFYQLVLGS